MAELLVKNMKAFHQVHEDKMDTQTNGDKTCCICLEVVVRKRKPWQRQFGILPQCSHCFCLWCIRKWRRSRDYSDHSKRAYPECLVKSDFVLSSPHWLRSELVKQAAIEKYKESAAEKQCRRDKGGLHNCSYGERCFYSHARSVGV